MNLLRRKTVVSITKGLAAITGLAVLPFHEGNSLRAQDSRVPEKETPGIDDVLAEMSAARAVYLMRSGELSAEDYVTALIDRFNAFNHLNIFISRDDDALLSGARQADLKVARGESTGSLHGLPVLLKDNIETADLPTSGGTPALAGYQSAANADVAQVLFDSGALLAGKANLHELAAGGSIGCVADQVLNPWDHGVRPGGSSSGNGAALAARVVPAAIGTDTGGSVRIPASLCGVSALRPTFGRYSNAGIVPISATRDTAGPMARTVADLALLDSVLSGETARAQNRVPEGIRLGVPRAYCYSILDGETARVIEGTLAQLEGAGVVLVEADIPGIEEGTADIRSAIAVIEIGRDLPHWLASRGSSIESLVEEICNPQNRSMFEREGPDEARIAQLSETLASDRARLRKTYLDYFSQYRLDAIVFPTTPLPARPVEQVDEVEIDGRTMSSLAAYNRNTMPGSSIGLPGISIPAGLTSEGLPVGLGLDSLQGSDRALLAIASAIESVIESANGPLPAPGGLP